MPRRRPPPRRSRPLPAVFEQRRVETGPDGYEYEVRPVVGSRATKTYRCPGCDHEIRPGTAHLVVWPADSGESAVEDRRHWHTPCWTHRATRGPTRRWS
ncbi:hypothetical protein [Mycolicibacterium monacense]|uniref:ATP/GTP-binding protein n=3 Tax=unclassified Mycobacterium TaxID=2642494 RepID=A0A5Q5BND7_MYCSS|nr:hypothetical protein [Mycolicibacterium monacense]ORB12152.1 hypothetical protein BST34_27540 [Mycolicibacterium monacense DSM 44395]QHP87419.1 hypothetical protein EWR22_19790 [Mycolicibacterium monacense DSM 44395]